MPIASPRQIESALTKSVMPTACDMNRQFSTSGRMSMSMIGRFRQGPIRHPKASRPNGRPTLVVGAVPEGSGSRFDALQDAHFLGIELRLDRKSTRLNSSHLGISY